MENARTDFVASVACDTPDFPADLVARLRGAVASGAPAAFVRAGGRSHPVFCLAPRTLAPSLRAHLEGGGRRVREWLCSVGAVEVDFGPDPAPFANLNTLQDLERRGAPEE
jgi:molybdopterin-guanine dinucleotide biosynthesis protein A